jgi:hypothetical protein
VAPLTSFYPQAVTRGKRAHIAKATIHCATKESPHINAAAAAAAAAMSTQELPALEALHLEGCAAADGPGQPVSFDPNHAHGTITLHLAQEPHRQLAVEVIRAWQESGGATWRGSTYNGQPFHMSSRLQWPQNLPDSGILQVGAASPGVPLANADIWCFTRDTVSHLLPV